ncbi:MAG: response regulator transcription factor [Prevotellaceae bacterium]|nr:response regulator transcription factor [Prevotellaceae bacterium]
MEQKRILIVDDEQDLCDILLFNLRAAGYGAEAVRSAEAAMQLGAEGYSLLLLDVMLPGMSGHELARRLKADRRTRHIPIIFLTARDTEEDTLQGFGLGADDYVTKPFSVREVMARVRAVLGRTTGSGSRQLAYEGLRIDTDSKVVVVDGDTASLTRTEYDLLRLLLEHRGQMFSRQQLIESVWPQDVIVTERTVDVNIARLRKKLNSYAACIVSRIGFGYSFEPKPHE